MYPLEVSIGTTWLGIRRTFFSVGSGGTVESSMGFEIEGGGPVYHRSGRKMSRWILFLLLDCLFEINLSSWVIFC